MNTHFTFTPAIVRSLMEIEAGRETVHSTAIPPRGIERLRERLGRAPGRPLSEIILSDRGNR